MVLDRLRRGGGRKDPKKIPDGLWVKCPSCLQTVFKRLAEERLDTCPECGHHFPMAARRRIEVLLDQQSWQEWDADMVSDDPLKFVDSKAYPARVKEYQNKTGLKEAVLCGRGTIDGGLQLLIDSGGSDHHRQTTL